MGAGLPRKIYRREASQGPVLQVISDSPGISAGAPGKVALLPSMNKRGNTLNKGSQGGSDKPHQALQKAHECRATLIDAIPRCGVGWAMICAARAYDTPYVDWPNYRVDPRFRVADTPSDLGSQKTGCKPGSKQRRRVLGLQERHSSEVVDGTRVY